MCLSEVLARHAHEHPVAVPGPSQASSAYSDSELGDDVMDSSSASSSMSHGPDTPDATTRQTCRPVLSLLTQIRPKYPTRPNERLAVLLPKSLWKPDNMADQCDIWTCPTQFSLFERRHHCRKCGGVFCQACSSQQTLLLDTTDLPFFYPPADVSLDDGPIGPMVSSRVCDDCHALIYGRPTPSSMAAQSCMSEVPTLSNSVSSASSSSVPFPSRPALSRTSSNLSAERARLRRNSPQRLRSAASSARLVSFNSHPAHQRIVVPEPPVPSDLGILSTYPLCQPAHSARRAAVGSGSLTTTLAPLTVLSNDWSRRMASQTARACRGPSAA
ncbi:hypothetical protein BDV93DRAFT_526177 [Ceratobasidium sp. AG-I]|nr:hypothetical protein BDV93DRAFT_526177 [Ceratobasidium sp. AG-I]